MREILFRGKSKDTGEWVYGYFVAYQDEIYIFEQDEVDKGIDIGGWLDCCTLTDVIPETVGQFTGLLDKNGVKIFKDDLVKGMGIVWHIDFLLEAFVARDTDTGEIYYALHEIHKYDRKMRQWISLDGHYEVVGNIHD